MSKKSARKNDSGEKEPDRALSSEQLQEERTDDQSGGSGSRAPSEGYVEYERGPDPRVLSERYRMDVRKAEAGKLQRLESKFGSERVQRWADEGMAIEAMGKPQEMRAFRKRQAGWCGEVPGDVEQRNGTSVRRSAAQSLLSKSDADQPTLTSVNSGVHIQPKLEVSSPNDPAEQEAESVAEAVMEMGEMSASSTQDGGDDSSGNRNRASVKSAQSTITQRSDIGSVSGQEESTVRSGVKGTGKPLPSATRRSFASKMGADFSDVRVHTGNRADAAARSINAEAYTIGSDIAFAKGNYAPDSKSGQRLLAHELTHVVQQGGARRSVARQESASSGYGGSASGGSGYGSGDGNKQRETEGLDLGEISNPTVPGERKEGWSDWTDEEKLHYFNLRMVNEMFRKIQNEHLSDYESRLNDRFGARMMMQDVRGEIENYVNFSDYSFVYTRKDIDRKNDFKLHDYTPLITDLLATHYQDLVPKLHTLRNEAREDDRISMFLASMGIARAQGPYKYEMMTVEFGGEYKQFVGGGGGGFAVSITYKGNVQGTESWNDKYGGFYFAVGCGWSYNLKDIAKKFGLDINDIVQKVVDNSNVGASPAEFKTQFFWTPDNFDGSLELQTIVGINLGLGGYEIGFGNYYGDETYPAIGFDAGGGGFGIGIGLDGPGTLQAWVYNGEDVNYETEGKELGKTGGVGTYEIEDLEQIFFGVDESETFQEDRLNQFINKWYPAFTIGDYTLEITGHASRTASEGYNKWLSQDRVNATKSHILNQLNPRAQSLFPDNTITYIDTVEEAKGESEALGEDETESMVSRRVDLKITGTMPAHLSIGEGEGGAPDIVYDLIGSS